MGFKGDRTKRSEPPAVKFKIALLSQVRGKKAHMDTIKKHFGATNATTIMPISDNETDMAVCRAILFPLKWAADVIAIHPYPYDFLQYIQEKTKEWMGSQACYILDWA